ncbi:metallophosphoesterase family protein [Ornithinibacillus salinisoli]|uniref:Metallophosphoesterase family protein n=1 Tax=Ornithinibacillus salinisoli TaxID=1848459 RepID=A0ABW4VW46_9BACI
MKFAIITDIHGNHPALRAVLNDIDQVGSIHHIYCLGDMIAIGPDTNEVLEELFTRKDVSMITGNHDESVLAILNGEPHPKSHAHVKEHHQWIAERMNPAFVEKMNQLPRTMKKNVRNYSIRFIHYSIDPSKLHVHISKDPFHRIVDPNLNNMEVLFADYPADLICFGHHHPYHYFQGSQTTYLNPSSLGCQDKPIAPYAIVTLENGRIDVQQKMVSYDNTTFLQSYQKLQVPGRDIIIGLFHGSQKG